MSRYAPFGFEPGRDEAVTAANNTADVMFTALAAAVDVHNQNVQNFVDRWNSNLPLFRRIAQDYPDSLNHLCDEIIYHQAAVAMVSRLGRLYLMGTAAYDERTKDASLLFELRDNPRSLEEVGAFVQTVARWDRAFANIRGGYEDAREKLMGGSFSRVSKIDYDGAGYKSFMKSLERQKKDIFGIADCMLHFHHVLMNMNKLNNRENGTVLFNLGLALFDALERRRPLSDVMEGALDAFVKNDGVEAMLEYMDRGIHTLERRLEEARNKQQALAKELEENKDKYREYYEKWNAEANKNVGFKRYKDEVNQRLALHEERVTILKRELDAYRMLHPESEEKVATIVAQAPDINEALQSVLKLTGDIVRAAERLNAMNQSPLFENNTVLKDYEYSKYDIEERGVDFDHIDLLLKSAKAIPLTPVFADGSKELLPHLNTLVSQLETALTEERGLRQNAGNSLAETLQKGASLAAMTYPDDDALGKARIDALHAVSLWREDINAANAFQLAQAGHAMNDAFGEREPSLERMLDEQAGTLDTVLRRVSPHVFPEDAPDDTDDINALFGSSFSEDDFGPTDRL